MTVQRDFESSLTQCISDSAVIWGVVPANQLFDPITFQLLTLAIDPLPITGDGFDDSVWIRRRTVIRSPIEVNESPSDTSLDDPSDFRSQIVDLPGEDIDVFENVVSGSADSALQFPRHISTAMGNRDQYGKWFQGYSSFVVNWSTSAMPFSAGSKFKTAFSVRLPSRLFVGLQHQ
jgi:hypothetical protein